MDFFFLTNPLFIVFLFFDSLLFEKAMYIVIELRKRKINNNVPTI